MLIVAELPQKRHCGVSARRLGYHLPDEPVLSVFHFGGTRYLLALTNLDACALDVASNSAIAFVGWRLSVPGDS